MWRLVVTAEQIVRALAATDPTTVDDVEDRWVCTMCDGATRDGGRHYLDVEDHEPGCPWRTANEWVALMRIGEHLGVESVVSDPTMPRGTFRPEQRDDAGRP